MDAKLRSVLLFDVAPDTPHRVLTEATDAGLAAARGIVSVVEANGALGKAAETTRRVRIELALRGTPAVVMEAERAFAAAFVSVVERRGHHVEQL